MSHKSKINQCEVQKEEIIKDFSKKVGSVCIYKSEILIKFIVCSLCCLAFVRAAYTYSINYSSIAYKSPKLLIDS